MSKVKLSSITVIGLLLILFIGVISYGCTSNKSVENPNSTLGKNNNQMAKLSADDGDSMSNNQNGSGNIESSKNGLEADNDNSVLSDSGLNGYRLRPEVQRILHSKFSSEVELQTALKGASILQDYLDRPNQDAVDMIKRYDCSVLALTQADQNLIQSLTFDTDERRNKIKDGLKDYKPAVSIEIEIDNQGNAISPCASIK